MSIKDTVGDEDIGTARLVARVRKEISSGVPLIPKRIVDVIAASRNRGRVAAGYLAKVRPKKKSSTDKT